MAVIPCLNEEKNLDRVLDQMLGNAELDLVIVADGGSTDDSIIIVERWAAKDARVRLLGNPDRIQSAGINQAVAHYGTGYEWLLRVDAHCIYPDDYLQSLIVAAHETGADSVVVPMITKGAVGFQIAAAAAQNSILGTGGSAHRIPGAGQFIDHGHHALMRIDVFRAEGGYCEAMPCNEDAELDHRLGLTGAKIWLEPKATITYLPRATPAGLWRQYFNYGIGRARNIMRHRMRPHLRQMAPLAVPAALAMLPLSFLHWLFAVPALAWISLCLLVGALTGVRMVGKGARAWPMMAGVAAAIMHLGWASGFIREVSMRKHAPAPKFGLKTRG